jgi:hypothetical protein
MKNATEMISGVPIISLHETWCVCIISHEIISMASVRGHVARMGAKRNACRTLVGKPEGKSPLGRPRHRRVDNIDKCRVVRATKMTGSSLDDWIYWHFGYSLPQLQST